jgi:hypothetical protein
VERETHSSPRVSALTAGILYLLVAVTGGFSMLYFPSLVVPGDAAATARNLLAHESMFRLGIVSGLLCQVFFVLLALALYRLFKHVNHTYALVMVAPFAPRFLAGLLFIACAGYVIDFLTRLLLPSYAATVSAIAGASKFGELAMIVWLLWMGVRPAKSV